MSVVSLWEIAIKSGLGRLRIGVDPVIETLDSLGMAPLALEGKHLRQFEDLPQRADQFDPFDRMLVSQAIAEGLPLLTADRRLADYPCDLRDARL